MAILKLEDGVGQFHLVLFGDCGGAAAAEHGGQGSTLVAWRAGGLFGDGKVVVPVGVREVMRGIPSDGA